MQTHIRITYFTFYRVCLFTCPTCSRTSCASYPTCSCASRASCSNVPLSLTSFVLCVLLCLTCFVPYVLLWLTCLVHHISCALFALTPYMPLIPRALRPSCANITFSSLVFPCFTWLFLIYFQLVKSFGKSAAVKIKIKILVAFWSERQH